MPIIMPEPAHVADGGDVVERRAQVLRGAARPGRALRSTSPSSRRRVQHRAADRRARARCATT